MCLADFYFENMKLFWPYDLYKYSEEQVLFYLVRHNYDVELALALISKWVALVANGGALVLDLDDLVDMMRRQDAQVTQAIGNYNLAGSKIFHAKLSIRETSAADHTLDD